MNTTLSTELYWLVLTTLMTALMWVPYIVNRLFEGGLWPALWDPQGETATKHKWAERMMRAHGNAVENLVVFAALVLSLQLAGLNSEQTATACIVYFYARLAHFLLFSFAVPVLRIVAFLVGFYAQMVLMVALLSS
ncbi:MAG TPA: MAPEG family protein [Gammaproteobacteria bacterium]|nr:MAPEG family protein [Gammaproteobacteria bacterium]